MSRLRLAQSLVTSLAGKIPRKPWAKQLQDTVAALAKDIDEKSKLVYSCARLSSPSPLSHPRINECARIRLYPHPCRRKRRIACYTSNR